MSEETKIAWTDSTVNFWEGCTMVSLGCIYCYANERDKRFHALNPHWGKGAPRQLHESAFKLAHKLNRKPWICDECGDSFDSQTWVKSDPWRAHCRKCDKLTTRHCRRIFSLSLGDWLDPEVPVEWLARMLETIRRCEHVNWQLLTKRPELFFNRLNKVAIGPWSSYDFAREWQQGKFPTNAWIGTSVENQEMADLRIPELLKIPAAKRFLSCEPLLGPVDLSTSEKIGPIPVDWWPVDSSTSGPMVDWVIIGGESGRNARPCNIEWIRGIVSQCKAAGVACFVKQLGSDPRQDLSAAIPEASEEEIQEDPLAAAQWDIHRHQSHFRLKHPKGGDPSEWPEDLRVQEFPS